MGLFRIDRLEGYGMISYVFDNFWVIVTYKGRSYHMLKLDSLRYQAGS